MASYEQQGRAATDVCNLHGSADAAHYLEEKLSGPVRNSIAAVLHDRPQDPLRYLAHALREQQQQQQKQSKRVTAAANAPSLNVPCTVKASVAALQSVIGHRKGEDPLHDSISSPATSTTTTAAVATTATPPLTLSLDDGRAYQVRPLSVDFARSNARHASRSGNSSGKGCDATAPPASFPTVLYREAASTFEVGSCLRRLQQLAPQVPSLLFVESPPPAANVFFYEGAPYACTTRSVSANTAAFQTDIAEDIAVALERFGGTVQSFTAALNNAAAEAAAEATVVFLPSLQTNFLAALDLMSTALDDAYSASWQRAEAAAGGGAQPHPPRANMLLPTVLLVSYRAETARLTHARLLAAYGPFYEAAQRVALQSLRVGQLERKHKFTFGFAMEYWAQVQRRRETSTSSTTGTTTNTNNTTAAAAAKTAAPTPADASSAAPRSNGHRGEAGVLEAGVSGTMEAAADANDGESSPDGSVSVSAAVKDLAKAKRVTARSVKRGLPAYDADQQAEDDVFLVVIRRMEHAAATLIQSVYRGHCARVRCQRERPASATPGAAEAIELDEATKHGGGVDFGVEAVPLLLTASLARLCEEGKSFQDVWQDLPTSPPPDSRRCWIYRPVQRTVKATPASPELAAATTAAGVKEASKGDATRVREDWVQEELLIPPVRATRPRVHVNLAQRLLDYLAVAECTILPDTVQLFADSPGLSVLQRRAYDQVKSICLTLFYVAYGELRQRDRASVPPTFSQYMCTHHAPVLTWYQLPHECSLLLRAVSDDCCDTRGEKEEAEHSAATARGRRAADSVVQAKLRANELFLVAHNAPKKTNASSSMSGTGAKKNRSGSALLRLTSTIFLSRQPLLPPAEWSREVGALAASLRPTGEKQQGSGASCIVHWWSLTAGPLCCLGDTPVAAVGRYDAQLLEGVAGHDCFVPRIRATSAERLPAVVTETESPMGTGALTAAAAAASGPAGPIQEAFTHNAAAAVVQAWTSGALADAEDAALVSHVTEAVTRDGYLEAYRAARGRGVAASAATVFTHVLPNAVLTKYAAAMASERSPVSNALNPAEDCAQFDGDESASHLDESHSARRRSVERRGGGWERVMEAVALEAASRRSSTRLSSIANSPRTSISASGWSRHVSPQQSTSVAASVSPTDSQEERHAFEAKGTTPARTEEGEAGVSHAAPQRCGDRVAHTICEVAEDVAAANASVVLRHVRRGLQFLPGAEGAAQVDSFVNMLTAALTSVEGGDGLKNTTPCLVLALDIVAQPFFAVAAVLVDHRLRNKREAVKAEKVVVNDGQTESFLRVDTDDHLRFLLSYHEVLATTLMESESGGTVASSSAKHSESVQLAIAHVADVFHRSAAATSSQSHLLARLQRAVREAEASTATTDVQRLVLQTVQLAEQYAWLVLLDWYLWSPHFAASEQSAGFAQLWQRAAGVRRWVQEMDPWAGAPERCPDPWHRQYSNGLRRWDDRHYVCFGSM